MKLTDEAKRIYNQIENWEYEMSEDFVDYFSHHINGNTFMTWCLGRKYISSNKFNLWIQSLNQDYSESNCATCYLYNGWNEKDRQFAVIISNEYNQGDKTKSHYILAEFISEIDVYKERLQNFLNDY